MVSLICGILKKIKVELTETEREMPVSFEVGEIGKAQKKGTNFQLQDE